MSTTMQTSTEKPRAENGLRRSTTATKMPPQAEIEEFFSATEKYEQKRFMEKWVFSVLLQRGMLHFLWDLKPKQTYNKHLRPSCI